MTRKLLPWVAVSVACGAAQAADDTDIVIGFSLPLTGINAAAGQEALSVATGYFEEMNRAGGVAGRRLKLEALDDRFDPKQAAENVARLADGKAVAIFNCFGTSVCNAMMPPVNAKRIPLVGGLAGGGAMREQPGRFAFNIRASTQQEIDYLVRHMATVNQKHIAVVYQDDPFGQSGLAAARKTFASLGLTPLGQHAIQADGSNAAAIVDAFGKLPKLNAVLMVASSTATVKLIQQSRRAGQGAQFYNLAAQANKRVVQELGDDRGGVVFSTLVPSPWKVGIPIVREYQKLYGVVGGDQNYSYLGMEVYINANVLVDGLRKAGRGVNRENLGAALESMGERRLGPVSVHYSADNHQGGQYVGTTIIGRYGRFLE